MKNDNFVTDIINKVLSVSQEFLRPLVSASLFLQRFDYFILLLTILLFVASLFTQTAVLGYIAMLIVVLTVLKLFFIRGQNVELTYKNLILLGFLAVCLISVFFSPYFMLSLKGFFLTFLYIAFYFSMVQFFRFNSNKIVPVIFIIMFLITFESAIAILQSLNPLDAVSSWQDMSYTNPEDMLSRVYGTLKPYNPNLLCGYLMVGLSSVITVSFWAFLYKHKKTFAFSVFALILTFCAIFATGTRSGYLGVFAAIIVGIFLINLMFKNYLSQKAQKIWKNICAVTLTGFGLVILMTPAILKRLLSIFIMRKDSSTSFRMNVYQAVWKMFSDNWFSGIGVGHDTFRNMYGLYMVADYTALSAYSVYLEVAVESGIFALLFIVSFFVMLIKSAVRFLNKEVKIEQKVIVISILIMLSGVFVQGIFDTILFRPQLQFLFWTNIAILSVILENNSDEKNNKGGIQKNIQQVIMNLSDFVTDKVKKLKEYKNGTSRKTTPKRTR